MAWVIESTDRTSAHGLQIEVYFTLTYDVTPFTTDLNKAFHFSTRKEAENLQRLLKNLLEKFTVVEIPEFTEGAK